MQPLVFCALREDILEGLRRHDGVKLERLPSMDSSSRGLSPLRAPTGPPAPSRSHTKTPGIGYGGGVLEDSLFSTALHHHFIAASLHLIWRFHS